MPDIPFDDGSLIADVPPDQPPDSSGLFDIWEDTSEDQTVLPHLETDVLEDSSREIGYPDELAEFWKFQGLTNDCGLYAQGEVLEADGQPFDLDKYRQLGIDGGWYFPEEGTYVNHIGDLIEENGVEVTRYEGASIQDMAKELDQGHGLIVAADCLPLWGEFGGHALCVTGMEVGADGKPTSIICNDSSRPDGQEYSYPYDNFKLAWDLYGNTMVATKDKLAVLE